MEPLDRSLSGPLYRPLRSFLDALAYLLLFSLMAALPLGCLASLNAYEKAKVVSDKVLPVFQDALELADQMRPLPGGQDALNAAAQLLTAWRDGNEAGFNAGVPCVKEALLSVKHAATLHGDEALASRLESVANVLQELDNGAVCADPGRKSNSGSGSEVPSKGSPLDGGSDAGAALERGLYRAPVRSTIKTVLVFAAAHSRGYRSAADSEQDRRAATGAIYRAHGDASEGTRPRSIVRASEHGGPTWGA